MFHLNWLSLKLLWRIRGRKYRFTENRPFVEKILAEIFKFASKIQKILKNLSNREKENLGKKIRTRTVQWWEFKQKKCLSGEECFVVDSSADSSEQTFEKVVVGNCAHLGSGAFSCLAGCDVGALLVHSPALASHQTIKEIVVRELFRLDQISIQRF